MSAKSKKLIQISLVLFVLLTTAVSCTTTNPPVDTRTGATSTY